LAWHTALNNTGTKVIEMDERVTISKALLQEMIDDIEDYAASRMFKTVERNWRTKLLEDARAALAPEQSIYQVQYMHTGDVDKWLDVAEEEFHRVRTDLFSRRIVYAAPSPTKDQT